MTDFKVYTGEKMGLQRIREMAPVLRKMPVVQVSELLAQLGDEELITALEDFTSQQQGLLITDLPLERQRRLLQRSSRRWFAQLFEHMPSEARADLYQEIDDGERTSLLPWLPKNVRENVLSLSAFPPETAGGIMSTDFATVQENMTCAEAIAKVRSDSPSRKMVYYVYVVDQDQVLQGFVTLKDLILAEGDVRVRDVLHRDFMAVRVDEDQEKVARTIGKYDLVAIPVLNDKSQLVGIVTHDEAIAVLVEEQTEDMEKFMGIMPDDAGLGYLDTTSWAHFKKRVIWLVSLAAIGIISGVIIHSYEGAIEKLLILALYMPMIADTGGNAGSQAATVVIRALALGQVKVRQWGLILWKEVRIALMLSVCLGIIAYGKVFFLSWETETPDEYGLGKIAFMISLALSLQVISSTTIGAGLPLLVKRFGGDPAVAASPAITTVVDITGLLIYFGLATFFFSL